MAACSESLLDLTFAAAVVEWRGPAPHYFLPVPADAVGEVRHAARQASYGWGCVPVAAEIGGVAFTTSLFPKDGGYLLPLKVAVRAQAGIAPGDPVTVRMTIREPAAPSQKASR
jgi:hypothetical protein